MSNVVLQYTNQYDLYNLAATSGYLVVDDGTDPQFSFTIPAGTFPSGSVSNMIRMKFLGNIGQGASFYVEVNGQGSAAVGGLIDGFFSSEILFTYYSPDYVGYGTTTVSTNANPDISFDHGLSSGSIFWTSDIVIKLAFTDTAPIINTIEIWQLTIETAYS